MALSVFEDGSVFFNFVTAIAPHEQPSLEDIFQAAKRLNIACDRIDAKLDRLELALDCFEANMVRVEATIDRVEANMDRVESSMERRASTLVRSTTRWLSNFDGGVGVFSFDYGTP